jgi:hypothetical protein
MRDEICHFADVVNAFTTSFCQLVGNPSIPASCMSASKTAESIQSAPAFQEIRQVLLRKAARSPLNMPFTSGSLVGAYTVTVSATSGAVTHSAALNLAAQ